MLGEEMTWCDRFLSRAGGFLPDLDGVSGSFMKRNVLSAWGPVHSIRINLPLIRGLVIYVF